MTTETEVLEKLSCTALYLDNNPEVRNLIKKLIGLGYSAEAIAKLVCQKHPRIKLNLRSPLPTPSPFK